MVTVTVPAAMWETVGMIAAGRCPARIREVCRQCRTSPAMLVAVMAAVMAAAVKVDGVYQFHGYLKDLARPVNAPPDGRPCYRVVRRCFKAARLLGLLEGVAADPYYDRGRFGRPPAAYCPRLPKWSGRVRRYRPPPPRGPGVPLTRAFPGHATAAPHRDVQTVGATVPVSDVDIGGWRPRGPIPADYRAAVEKLTAKRWGGRRW